MPHTCEPSNSDCYSILCLRLARFNDMQTKRDQRNAEDTLSLNRPSIVERDFRDLKSEERVDALIIIKDRYKNEIYVSPERLSCIIFEVIAIELQRYFKRTFIGKWQGSVGYTHGHLHELVNGHNRKASTIWKHYENEHNSLVPAKLL